MVRLVPGYPRANVEFRHALDIAQQKGGLALCTSLLQRCFIGEWSGIDAVACCESGGFVFAPALAVQVEIPLAMIRECVKIPPPKFSVPKTASHISALIADSSEGKTIEMSRDVVPKGGSVVVVDDVLATGRTLRATLLLLEKAGIRAENMTVMVVSEFPAYRGRQSLGRPGFGCVRVRSLFVFDGA